MVFPFFVKRDELCLNRRFATQKFKKIITIKTIKLIIIIIITIIKIIIIIKIMNTVDMCRCLLVRNMFPLLSCGFPSGGRNFTMQLGKTVKWSQQLNTIGTFLAWHYMAKKFTPSSWMERGCGDILLSY